jgi:hypothetical protein
MPDVISRKDADLTFEGGSGDLEVFLTQAQAEQVWADLAAPDAGWTDGWYGIGLLEGGSEGPDRDSERYVDEARHEYKQSKTRDEYLIGNSARQTDDHTLALLEWLESNYVRARRPLPAGFDAEGYALMQLWCFESARVDTESWTQDTTASAKRMRPFKLRAVTRPGAAWTKPYRYRTVRMDAQDTWPAWMNPFKDAPAAAA